MKKRIHVIIITFSLICSLFWFGSLDVFAYENESNFFVFDPSVTLTFEISDGSIKQSSANISNGSYNLTNTALSNVTHFTVLNASTEENWTFAYNHDIYDYYLLGTVTAISSNTSFTFKPTVIDVYYKNSNGSMDMYSVSDLYLYDIGGWQQYGFGFFEKINFTDSDNTGIRHIYLGMENNLSGSIPANIKLEFGVMAVEKGSAELDSLSSILFQLQNMESSLNSSLGSIDNSIDSGVNSITNGYSDTTVDSATDEFNDSASELEDIESDLSSTSNDNVSSFTDTFDDSIVVNLGSSLVYVVTWFSNFWNLGGLFTQLLSVSLALYVAFFIIFRRG